MKSTVTMPESVSLRVEATRVFRGRDYIRFTLKSTILALTLAAVVSDIGTWHAWRDHPVLLASLVILGGLWLVNMLGRWVLLPAMKRPTHIPPQPGLRVAVVTTFAPEAESLDILEPTLRSLRAMDYPHDTWVLDEGDDPRVRGLCDRVGAHYFSRKHRPEYQGPLGDRFQSRSKHGNYNSWLHEIGFAEYDVLVAFDSDHVPLQRFLLRTLGYFNDPQVAYVQAAQAYRNQDESLVARGAAEETYGYYSSIQMAAFGLGHPIIVGCHNAHRMAALRAVGGFAAHDADDLLLTWLYRKRGWEGVYVPEILARGLTPSDWPGYLRQQRRWARSVLDLKIRRLPHLCAGLPAWSRAMALVHGVNYLQRGVCVPLWLALLAGFILADLPGSMPTALTVHLLLLMGSVGLAELYRQRFYLDQKSERGLHWRAMLLQCLKWPVFLLAVLDVVLNRRLPYATTPKRSASVSKREPVSMAGVAIEPQ